MSKQSVFSPAQNAALRAELVALEGGRTRTELGRDLGIAQQNVTRLLNDERSGFAYGTASRLVRLVGFEGVDAFFMARGCSVPVPVPTESGRDVECSLHAKGFV